jgi:MFS family permease
VTVRTQNSEPATGGPDISMGGSDHKPGSAYRECLRRRYAKYLILSNLTGRLPSGMAVLAIEIFLRQRGAGYSVIGALVGVYGLGTAVGGPVLSRAVDIRGQAQVLAASAVVSSAGFITLLLPHRTVIPAAIASVFVAGFFYPPLEPCLRSLWPSILPDERTVAAAYSLDASLQEIIFIVGPLLATGVAVTMSPAYGLVLTAAVVIAGTTLFLGAPPVRRWRAEKRDHGWIGPLGSAQIWRLLISLAFVGFAVGVFNVAAVGYADRVGIRAMSGVLLGMHAAGALVGGLLYGSRDWPGSRQRHLVFTLGGLTICYIPLISTAPPVFMSILMGCAGLFLSPVLACGFVITAQLAPRGTRTESAAWLVAMIGAGIAAGSAVAGTVMALGLHAVFALPCAAGISAVTAATIRFRLPAVRGRGERAYPG